METSSPLRHSTFLQRENSAQPPAEMPGRMSKRRRIVVVERRLTHYRVPFYNRLRDLLAGEGIELELLIGAGTEDEARKQDLASLDWAIPIPTYHFFGKRLCWQPFGTYARKADLVVVNHENKMLYNLWLLFFRRPKRLAFWGHGRNMQSLSPDGLKERFKRWTVAKADWWFAYTDMSAELVETTGFPRHAITVVENAADTREMTELCDRVRPQDLQSLRQRWQLDAGPVGIYIGSFYPEKRIDFLLASACRVRQKIPDFQLVIAGAGLPREQEWIDHAVRANTWIHYVGPLHGADKAAGLMLADVLLNPGAVGLGIQDSFVSGTPMLTTDCGLHGPEISYLHSGINGIMTAADLDSYASSVAEVLSVAETLGRLRAGSRGSAPRYTIENMAERFHQGVLACLEDIC